MTKATERDHWLTFMMERATILAGSVTKHWPAPPWVPNQDEDGVWDGTWSAPGDAQIDGSPNEDYAVEFSQLVASAPLLAQIVRRWAPVIAAARAYKQGYSPVSGLFDAVEGLDTEEASLKEEP